MKAKRDTRGEFAEKLALIYERAGLPRMAGRILGWLLVGEESHPTLEELARDVHGSKASMSTMTRLLEQIGIVERLRRPGEKRDRVGIRAGVWSEISRREVELARTIRELCDGTMAGMPESSAARQRLWGFRAQYAFLEVELPRVFERFRKQNPLAAGGPPTAGKTGRR